MAAREKEKGGQKVKLETINNLGFGLMMIGIGFWLGETVAFGGNMYAASQREHQCDNIAAAICLAGMFISVVCEIFRRP